MAMALFGMMVCLVSPSGTLTLGVAIRPGADAVVDDSGLMLLERTSRGSTRLLFVDVRCGESGGGDRQSLV